MHIIKQRPTVIQLLLFYNFSHLKYIFVKPVQNYNNEFIDLTDNDTFTR